MYKIIGADQKEYGPVSADQLRQWIAEGRVNSQTRVQPAGSTDWHTMGSLPEFAPLLPPVAPPLPPSAAHPAVAPSATNKMAVWSLVTGILSLICCGFLAPVAIVLGAVALGRLKHQPGQSGTGMAIAGIVLGSLALVVWVIFVAFGLAHPGAWPKFPPMPAS